MEVIHHYYLKRLNYGLFLLKLVEIIEPKIQRNSFVKEIKFVKQTHQMVLKNLNHLLQFKLKIGLE